MKTLLDFERFFEPLGMEDGGTILPANRWAWHGLSQPFALGA